MRKALEEFRVQTSSSRNQPHESAILGGLPLLMHLLTEFK